MRIGPWPNNIPCDPDHGTDHAHCSPNTWSIPNSFDLITWKGQIVVEFGSSWIDLKPFCSMQSLAILLYDSFGLFSSTKLPINTAITRNNSTFRSKSSVSYFSFGEYALNIYRVVFLIIILIRTCILGLTYNFGATKTNGEYITIKFHEREKQQNK